MRSSTVTSSSRSCWNSPSRRAFDRVHPTILLAQFVLLPLYLWTFIGQTFAEIFEAGPLARVFVLLLLVPHACSSGAVHSFDMPGKHLVDQRLVA
jgi:hypothetical protein